MTTPQDRREQEKLDNELRRSLIHLRIASFTLQQLRDHRLTPQLQKLAPFAKEVIQGITRCVTKLEWFIGVAQRSSNKPLKGLIHRDVNAINANFCNIADLSEWVIEQPRNIDNEVDLVINHSRRRDILMRSWRVALDRDLTQQDMLRFNAWYNANFHGEAPIHSTQTKQRHDSSSQRRATKSA